MKLPFSKPRIEDLDRYVARGEYDRALEAVAVELKRHPAQFNLLLRQAEILGLAGNRERALGIYRELAERFAGDGFYAKAIALYKKMLRLDPGLEDVHGQLARLIEEDLRSRRPLDERLPVRERQAGRTDRGADTAEAATDADDSLPPEAGPSRPDSQALKELKASELFGEFSLSALEEILASTSLRSYEPGETIVSEGAEGSSLFLLVSGSVDVSTLAQGDEPLTLAELGPGDFFGEVSLLTGRPRTATITAREFVLAIELDRSDLDAIATRHPEVRSVLERFYERRAQSTVEAVIRRMRQDT